MRHDSPIADVLQKAMRGSNSAWREIHDRYSPLVRWVCRGYGLTGADADDVSGTVWLHLVANVTAIRVPEALPGWLRTTAQHECVRVLRHRRRQIPQEIEAGDRTEPASDEALLAGERRAIVRAALDRMPERDRQLLSLLFSDPPTPYSRISSTLGMPIGAIGPTRQRCLARMSRLPSIMSLRLRSAEDSRVGG
ncbi:MAG TPA: sigma-70 family RNA polymerase sigma factor [Umezawaea sp.]|nr:sigma-70 family RNA polymerase sigma factor [Umezawaea sp.]